MKRILAVILSLIILIETVVPCCVFDSCAQEVSSVVEHNDKEKGDCSPFSATCSSCVTGIALPDVPLIKAEPAAEAITHYSAPLHFSLSSYSNPLYQPPKQA